MNILITGGAGYIGSVVVECVQAGGHNTFVVDNLVKGHREMVRGAAGFVRSRYRGQTRYRTNTKG